MPLVGEWIYDKHERPFDCLTHFVLEIGDFVNRVKQKTLFYMSWENDAAMATHVSKRKFTIFFWMSKAFGGLQLKFYTYGCMPHGLYVGGLSLILHEAQFHSAGIGGIGGAAHVGFASIRGYPRSHGFTVFGGRRCRDIFIH